MTKPIKLGVIGPGWASSKFYGTAILRCPDLTLHSVYSRSLERAETFGDEFSSKGAVRSFDDLDVMLADKDLDAVAIVNPDGLHCEAAIKAANAGKSVFVEKPMGLTSAECEAMIAACAENKTKLAVGYRLRFHGGHRAVMDGLHAGRLGRLRLVRMHMELVELGDGSWRNRSKLGKWWTLSKFGTHFIDMALWAVQQPVSAIEGFNGIVRHEEGGNDRDSSISWSYADGPMVQIFSTNSWGDGASRMELHTDQTVVEMTDTIGFDCGGPVRIGGEELQYDLVWEFEEQLGDFARAIKEDREPFVGGDVGLENVRVLELCDQKLKRVVIGA